MKDSVLAACLAGTVRGGVGFAMVGALVRDHGQHSHRAHDNSEASSEVHTFIRNTERDMAKMMNHVHLPGCTGSGASTLWR